MSSFTRYSGRYQKRKPRRKKSAAPAVLCIILLVIILAAGWKLLSPLMQSANSGESDPTTGKVHTTKKPSIFTKPTEETTQPTTQPTEPAPTLPPMTPAERAIYDFAQANGISLDAYPEELVALLERNPDTKDFVLHYPLEHDKTFEVNLWEHAGSDTMPLFMQWDRRWGYMDYGGELAAVSACGPVCLSMVVCYLTGDYSYSPDVMMRYALDSGHCVPGQGTYWSFINIGGKHFGLDVFEFSADKNRILANLEVGNPVICLMGPGDFTDGGHFIVLTGLEDGLIRINDPNSYVNSEKLWDYDTFHNQIKNVWVLRR